MTNKFFPDEQITENDLYFLCYMVECVVRKLHQKNKYVVNSIPKNERVRLISLANVLHCENPLKIEAEWMCELKWLYEELEDVQFMSHLVEMCELKSFISCFFQQKLMSHLVEMCE